jgi:GNAT superfamily N-acetyltransferase
MHVRAWQAAYRGLLFDELLDSLEPDRWVERYRFGEDDATGLSSLVAVEADEICGFATFGACADEDRADRGELLALYVDPDRQGLGVGRVLIEQARARLFRHGYGDASLWMLSGNERADRFYRIDGWAPDGARRPAKVPGYSVEDIRYYRLLP